jgi:hypothetical protein
MSINCAEYLLKILLCISVNLSDKDCVFLNKIYGLKLNIFSIQNQIE